MECQTWFSNALKIFAISFIHSFIHSFIQISALRLHKHSTAPDIVLLISQFSITQQVFVRIQTFLLQTLYTLRTASAIEDYCRNGFVIPIRSHSHVAIPIPVPNATHFHSHYHTKFSNQIHVPTVPYTIVLNKNSMQHHTFVIQTTALAYTTCTTCWLQAYAHNNFKLESVQVRKHCNSKAARLRSGVLSAFSVFFVRKYCVFGHFAKFRLATATWSHAHHAHFSTRSRAKQVRKRNTFCRESVLAVTYAVTLTFDPLTLNDVLAVTC